MTIVEYVENIFKSPYAMPKGFVQNPMFDAVLLINELKMLPELIRARNGFTYLYFDRLNRDGFALVRKMGLKPRLHKSRREFPPKNIHRALINRNVPRSVWNIVNALDSITIKEADAFRENPLYAKYIENYGIKTK